MGGGGSRFLPGFGSPNANVAPRSDGTLGVVDTSGRQLAVAVTMRIPKHRRRERALEHPATISSLTQSVGIAVNTTKARVFNATTASPNCVATVSGRACTFVVGAPAGTDKFTVTTYSGANGTGVALNRGIATVPILKGKANSPHIVLGPLVSTAANTGLGSLRYAIGSANPGDTILFSLPASAKITLTSPITLGTNVTIAGPGVTASLRTRKNRRGLTSDTTFTGMTISGGGSQQVFVINAGVKVTISGLVITDGKASVATHPGGAISNLGALTLAGDAITDSTSVVTTIKLHPHLAHPKHALHGASKARPVPAAKLRPANLHPHCAATNQLGGAVYNDGSLVVTGTTFDSNSVSSLCGYTGYGGAIYNDSDGSVVSSGSVYSNNHGQDGGAVYNDGAYGQASFTNDKFMSNVGCTTATGCVTGGCTATAMCSSYAQGDGGAIYDADGPGITVTSSTFSGNVAGGASPSSEGNGGAIYLAAGSPLITGSTFSGNLAGGGNSSCSYGYGGAIYEDAGGPVEIDKDIFTGNKAGGDYYSSGGAIYNDSNPDNGSGDTFTNNETFATGSLCSPGYDSYAWGGAISAYYGINISGSTFTGNVATASYWGYGGAIYVYENGSNISGNTFTGNKVLCTTITDVDGYAYAAGVYVDSGSATVKLSKNTFTSNQANAGGPYGYEVYGGVIYIDTSATVASTGNTFTSNTTMASYPDDGEVYGMVVYHDGSSFASTGDVFKSNVAANPVSNPLDEAYGVIYSVGSASVTNDTFASNSASAFYVYGAAIENDSTMTVTNSTFTGNIAGTTGTQQGYGGAIYDEKGATVNGSTFTGNKATAAGGAYYDDSGATINNSTITGNSVSNATTFEGGGGLYAFGTTINNSTISGNSVTPVQIPAGGGGIWADGSVTVNGSTISGNKVLGSLGGTGGGGVFVYTRPTPGPNAFTNSTITGNSSGIDGGGVETFTDSASHDEFVTFFNTTIYQNKAAGFGGGIENLTAHTFLANSIVAGDTAATGADIDNQGTLTSSDFNLIQAVISGNALSGTTTHDITAKSPLLLALTDNGGPTFTNAESATSPTIGKIPVVLGSCNGSGVKTDQRGYTRGATVCDMGAFELHGMPSAIRPQPRHQKPPAHVHRNARHRHPKRPLFEIHPHKGSK